MPSPVRRFDDVVAVSWRNERGSTSELVDEATAETLTPGRPWRLSVARLRASAPFSTFPGVRRTLVPWGGDVTLEIDGGIHHVPAGTPIRFRGDATTALIRIDEPCHAINLMAPGERPTLARARAGETFATDILALLGEAGVTGERFDLVRLAAGERMPVAGVVVRA